MTKLYVSITDEEFVRLSQLANRECRHPRDQARHILRGALLGDEAKKDNRQDASNLPGASIKAVAA